MPRIACLLISLSLLNPVFAASSLQDFAFQAELSASDQELQRVGLPLDVLLNVTRADLGDIEVFNRAGKPLPHAISKAQNTVTDHSQVLPFHEFSRFQQQSSKVVTKREQNQQSGQISELKTTETISVQSERKDYLIELAPDDDRPNFDRIELQWTHEPANQLLRLKVEYGNELDQMRALGGVKNLANRESDDASWRSIRGIPRKQKYLRLIPDDSVTRFELLQVDGFYQETQPAPQISHALDTVLTEEDNRKLYYFENPAQVRVDKMRIVPGEAHSIVSGSIYSSREDYEKRQLTHANFRQHNISDDEVAPSKPIELRRSLYRHVWLSTNDKSAAPPSVELIYPQYELIFLGDGNGPYRLAWGNHESEAQVNNLSAVLEDNLHEAQQRGVLVTMGPIQDAGGESRLTPEAQLPWQKWLLWGFLIFAALVTARMAIKLFREMNLEQPANPQT